MRCQTGAGTRGDHRGRAQKGMERDNAIHHNQKTITVPVYGLNFATCGQTIERRLSALPGVMQVDAKLRHPDGHHHL